MNENYIPKINIFLCSRLYFISKFFASAIMQILPKPQTTNSVYLKRRESWAIFGMTSLSPAGNGREG